MFIHRLLKQMKSKSANAAIASPMIVCEAVEPRTMLSGGAWTRLDAAAHDMSAAPVLTALPTAGSQKATPFVRRSPVPYHPPSWIGNFTGTLTSISGATTPFFLSILAVTKTKATIAFSSAGTGLQILQGHAAVNFGDVAIGKNATITMSQASTGTVVAIRLTWIESLFSFIGYVFVSNSAQATSVNGTFFAQ